MSELKQPDASDQEQATEDWATRWGHMLRLARQVAGLSLQEVANRSGLSKGYLSKLESGQPSAL
ncbi:MAG TPA: helix-turn-helix transcriptional regulator, partial [Ktedonobacterales bacterium]